MNRESGVAKDPFVTFDAAYVLGALSPEDRAAFEDHLRDCDDCARSVRELAGLPGLLAHADPGLGAEEPAPPELLLSLSHRVGRARRRRLLATLSAAAVVLVACLALVITFAGPGAGVPPATAMTSLGAYPVHGSARITESSEGAQVWMSCSYGGTRAGDYVLVAVRRQGGVTELASWHALPDDTAELSVGTALHRNDIRSLEIRVPGGPTVLRLIVQ